jgi:hypothetical protein
MATIQRDPAWALGKIIMTSSEKLGIFVGTLDFCQKFVEP